jgi:putative ABC transport system permease protein
MKVVGIFRAGPAYDSEVWLDRDAARTIFGRGGRVSSVYVRLESAEAFNRFKAALDQDKALGVQAFREREYFQIQTEGRADFIAVMGLMIGGLFGIGAMIGAMVTMFAAVESRQREVGTLRAIGFSRTTILFGFLLESALVAIAAGLVGALIAGALSFTPFTILDLTTRAEIVLAFEPTPEVIAAAIITSLLMGLGGGLLPAWRASHVSVIEALRA